MKNVKGYNGFCKAQYEAREHIFRPKLTISSPALDSGLNVVYQEQANCVLACVKLKVNTKGLSLKWQTLVVILS